MPMSINRSTPTPVILMPGGGETLSIMGMTIAFKTTGRQSGGQFSAIEVTEQAGSASPVQYNQVFAIASYVLEGTATLQVGDETIELGPGGYAYLPAGTVYQFRNDSAAPVKYLTFSSPAGLDEYIAEAVRLVAGEPSWPPADMSKLVALRTKYHFYDPPAG